MSEQQRIDFLLHRDGLDTTIAWIRRTMQIYRRAVLEHSHFAGKDDWRRKYIEGYCEFKRWLVHQERERGSAERP